MTTSFTSLNLVQKLVTGGIIGSCSIIFLLNGVSNHDRERRLRELGRASTGIQIVRDGRLQPSQNPRPSIPPSPFLENVWSPQFIQQYLVLNLQNIQAGRWYTVLTCGFNHASVGHIAMNMLTFLSVGVPLISVIGTPAFLTIWVTSGITCGAASIMSANYKLRSALSQPQEYQDRGKIAKLAYSNYVGASGSVFGLVAASAVIFPNSTLGLFFIPYHVRAMNLVAALFAGSVVADYNDWLPGIGHLGHAGGMVAGTAIGFMIKRFKTPRFPIAMAVFLAHPSSHLRQFQNR